MIHSEGATVVGERGDAHGRGPAGDEHAGDEHPKTATDGGERPETTAERLDRNLAELLQELRVASLGVQVLFGFLLALPFYARFTKLDGAQRDLYVADLLLATAAIILLGGPVAYHRLVFRQHDRGRIMATANRMAIVGLLAIALAVSGAVLLAMSLVLSGAGIAIAAVAVALGFAVIWFALPITTRWRHPRDGHRTTHV